MFLLRQFLLLKQVSSNNSEVVKSTSLYFLIMWENTVTVAINPEFSKNLIERIKQNIIPELKRTEGKGDQYVVDELILFIELNPQHIVAQDLRILRELKLAKINFIQI